jgi:hypothetical protein
MAVYRMKNTSLFTVPRHGDCSKSPHRPVECHPAARTASSRASTTWLVGLASPTLAAQLTSGRSGRYGGCAGRCALRVIGPIQTVPCRFDRRESTVESRCGSDLAVPTCSGVGRSLATRPRAVTPEWPEDPPARGDRHAPGSGFDKGRSCTCWPRPDDPCPCTPQTCDWGCRAIYCETLREVSSPPGA